MNLHRVLVRIAVVGSIVSVACFAAACVLVDTAVNLGSGGEIVTRELPWDGSEVLVVDVPADVEYRQEAGPGKLIATGPRRSVDTLQVSEGHIHDGLLRTGARLRIVATAPGVKAFRLKGGDKLVIENFDQDTLAVTMQGGSEIQATGRAGAVDLSMTGFGTADLGQLTTDRAQISMSGWTSARIAPKELAELDMTGFTKLELVQTPAKLSQRLAGRARVVQESTPAQ